MTQKERFPFQPFQDSFLLEVLLKLYSKDYPDNPSLVDQFAKNWNSSNFTFTPNQWKQINMVNFANSIRSWIESGSDEKVLELLEKLVRGEDLTLDKSALDVSLELVEWIFTGFEKDSLVLNYFHLLFGDVSGLDLPFLKNLRELYDLEVQNPNP